MICEFFNTIFSAASLNRSNRESEIQKTLAIYNDSRKMLDNLRIDGDATGSIGIECLKIAYRNILCAKLTTYIDRSKKLSEQIPEKVVPTLSKTREIFDEITTKSCPDMGIFFTSVISILKTIDKSKILWKKDKKYCAMCIQNQTTLYEGLWLHYYNVLKKKDAELLYKYHIIDGIPQSELFAIAE